METDDATFTNTLYMDMITDYLSNSTNWELPATITSVDALFTHCDFTLEPIDGSPGLLDLIWGQDADRKRTICPDGSYNFTNDNSNAYRFGFNGMERDDDVNGGGNSLDFGARIYDSRLGRWFKPDYFKVKYPSLTPYNFVVNNPLIFIDNNGNDFIIFVKTTTTTHTHFSNSDRIMVNQSVDESFSILVIPSPGPDRYWFEEKDAYVNVDFVNGKFTETDNSSQTINSTEMFPEDWRSHTGVTQHVTRVMDGLIPWKEDDSDGTTVGKFMNGCSDFNNYMRARNSNASGWASYASTSDFLDGFSVLVQAGAIEFTFWMGGGIIAGTGATAELSLIEMSTFEGASPSVIRTFLEEEGWTIKEIKNGGGFKAYNPAIENDVIHVIEGNAAKLKPNTGLEPVKQGDYLKRPSIMGGDKRIPLEGNPVLK